MMGSHNRKALNDFDENDEEDDLRPSFHIRVAFGNSGCSSCHPDSGLSSSSDIEASYQARQQNAKYCHHSSLIKQNETAQCSHQTIDIGGFVGNPTTKAKKQVKSFKYIEPQTHKSALYVNLSSASGNGHPLGNPQDQHHRNQELFISPDLNQSCETTSLQSLWEHCSPGSSPPSSLSSCSRSTISTLSPSNDKLAGSVSLGSYELLEEDTYKNPFCRLIKNSVGAMSQSCNFINMWSAGINKRRSASVSPSSAKGAKDATTSTTVAIDGCDDYVVVSSPSERRSSSSNDFNQGEDLLKRSSSGNHLAPLQVEIDSPSPSEDLVSEFSSAESEVLQIDLENLKLDKELLELEREAEYWEQKVEELERKQFADNVPRTLVENIIKHRKELRELEFKIYELSLSEDCLKSPSIFMDGDLEQGYFEDKLMVDHHDLGRCEGLSPRSASKFGSRIKPGQENTADILNAIPPSGSLQHRQYLSKASTGTDTSEYSQMPTFEQHSHRVGGQRKSSNNATNRSRRQDLYAQVESGAAHRLPAPDHGTRSSPVRPNHFKCPFRSPKIKIAPDSSSTASSGSPQ